MRLTCCYILTALVAVTTIGCGEQPAVRAYTTDKPAGAADEPVDVSGGPMQIENLIIDVPEGWANKDAGSFVLARFELADGGQVTVSRAGGDLTGNINRWRGQLGLPAMEGGIDPTTLGQIKSPAGEVFIVDLREPGADPQARCFRVGMMAHRDGGVVTGQTWFFKFDGSAQVLEQHRGTFDQMLGALRLTGDSEANDG